MCRKREGGGGENERWLLRVGLWRSLLPSVFRNLVRSRLHTSSLVYGYSQPWALADKKRNIYIGRGSFSWSVALLSRAAYCIGFSVGSTDRPIVLCFLAHFLIFREIFSHENLCLTQRAPTHCCLSWSIYDITYLHRNKRRS